VWFGLAGVAAALAETGSNFLLGACAVEKGNMGSEGGRGSGVTAIGAENLWLRSASGREELVAWDTLRDRESGRLRLTYGDALTIDATQGLTSTEHIEAMPADTRAVYAFKADTSGSRAPAGDLHRRFGRRGAEGDRRAKADLRSTRPTSGPT
jgi:hypothetical protein